MIAINLDNFRLFLLEKGQMDSTVRTNLKLFKKIALYCSPLTQETFSAYIDKMVLAQNAGNYIRQVINVIRFYGEFIKDDTLASYPYRKLRQKNTFVRGTLSEEEIEAFIHLPYPNKLKGVFEKQWYMFSMFWCIQAWTGCRPSEVASMDVSSVDFGTNEFHVDGKTGPRDIPISSAIYERVKEYISSLEGDLLFPSMQNRNKPVGQGGWEKNFNKRKDILNIKRDHVSAYSFRHSFASRLVDESSIYKVKTLMGHKKITTTEKYIHTNKKALQRTIESDPLSDKYKDGVDILREILKREQKFDEKYHEKIYTHIELSEDGEELVVKFKVKA